MKKIISIVMCGLVLVGLMACAKKTTTTKTSTTKIVETGQQPVIHETKFDSSYIGIQNEDMTNFGFTFGDSCDVYFSNGKSILDVPYYDGYYTRSDFPLVCGYQGYPYVQITINNGSEFWEKYELSEEMTVNIVLNEKGKYLNEQEAFSMHYYNEREKYTSDEEFANFRMVKTTNIKEGVLYRGASPFNNNYNRVSYVDSLLKANGIKFILDLSDSEADLESYKETYDFSSSYAINQKKVLLSMGSNFRLDGTDDETSTPDSLLTFSVSTYKESLVKGLNEMIESEGPYYVHCVEGKDRTGFVCMLLEALCGATYEEMKTDYMITYTNYFGITEKDPKYEAVVNLRFDEFMEYLSGSTDIKNLSYVEYAREYLEAGGMTDENIDKLINVLTK